MRGAVPGALADQVMLVIDAHALVRHCSRGAAEFFGAPQRAIWGHLLSEFMPQLPLRRETPGYNMAFLVMNFAPGAWHVADVRIRGGPPRPVEVSLATMRLGRHLWLALSFREAEAGLQPRTHLERLLASLELSPDPAVVTSAAGVIEYVNPAYETLTGYGFSEVVGQTQRLVKSGLHPPSFYADLWGTLRAGRSFHATFANRAKDGRLYHLDQVIRPFMDRGGEVTHYVSTGQDVSHQVKAQAELQQRADFDSLTGLANRYLLRDRLHQEIARARREGGLFTLVCVDLDGFKAINDHYGHLAGDAVLRAVSTRILGAIREMDTLGRWGGDEFLLILPGVYEPVDVQAVMAKIVASMESLQRAEQVPRPVTVSVGAALYPADAERADDLIHKADLAMYQAKLRGGNGYCAWGTALWERRAKTEAGKATLPQRVKRGQVVCLRGGARP